jgi:cytochrome d ubiquinol oxidase subunit II
VTVLAGYATLGAGWLRLKGEDATRGFARAHQRWLPIAFFGLTIITAGIGAVVQPKLIATWRDHAVAISICSLVFSACALRIASVAGRDDVNDRIGFGLALAMMLSGLAAFVLSVFPNVIPFRISLWEAASGTASHKFLLIGAVVVTPVVITYSAFSYWVFHGRTPAEGWES